MSSRTLRRAAERQTLKQTLKAGSIPLAQQAPTGGPETAVATASANADQPPPGFAFAEPIDGVTQSSEARIAANRANAQFSTGPKTPEGKAKSSMNAVKTGLTGRTVLLPTDDAAIYRQHLDRNFAKFSPANDDEHILVQTIADTEWRLLRIAPLEAALYALGHRKLAGEFADETNTANREALIMAEVYVVYRRELSNLALQERRLRSQRKADLGELQQLQQQRAETQREVSAKRQEQVSRAITLYNQAAERGRDFDPARHGFDFSLEELHAYGKQNSDQNRFTETDLDFDQWLSARRAAAKEPKSA
jgi:hypothetical protein